MPFADRIYCETNPDTGLIDCYCRTREGSLGPFDSEQMAMSALQGHLTYFPLLTVSKMPQTEK